MNFICESFPTSLSASQKRPKHYRIGVNPTDCSLLKAKAGDVYNLVGSRKKTCVQLWPNALVPSNVIYVSSHTLLNAGVHVNESVGLEPMSGPMLDAIHVSLILEESLDSSMYMDLYMDDAFVLYAKEFLIDTVYLYKDMLIDIPYLGTPRRFRISNLSSRCMIHEQDACYKMIPRTKVYIEKTQVQRANNGKDASVLDLKQIGGLTQQIAMIRELIQVALFEPEVCTKFELDPPKGVLLYGPSGTGKTILAKAMGSEFQVSFLTVNGPEMLSKYYGETESKLHSLFEEARQKSPCILFIDEMDGLCPKRENASSDIEKRAVASLLALMDGVDAKTCNQRLFIIGATNRPDAIDDAFRRPGRLDQEIEIGIPNASDRLDILMHLLDKIPHELSHAQIQSLAVESHGYVGADLAALIQEAGIKSLQSMFQCMSLSMDSPEIKLTWNDFQEAKKWIKPSAMREIFLEVPQVYWRDIGGQEDVKQQLIEAIEWPLKHPEIFEKFHIKPPKGILLYGPPGCSKTLMAKALATEAGFNFIAIKGPELLSKWVGESEKAIQQVFKRARAASPAIVFFDEIDSIAIKRESEESSVGNRVLSQLLNEMDGIEPLVNVIVVAATNRPDILDPALLRPGRIDRKLYVSPPDLKSRMEILKLQIKKMAVSLDVDVQELATLTDGFSGAETVSICSKAGFEAMQENLEADHVERKHFLKVISETRPRITTEMLEFYQKFQKSIS